MEVAEEGRRIIAPVDESELPAEKETAVRASEAKWVTSHDEGKEEEKTEEAPKGQATSEQQQPELLMGKFKSVEELGKSYQELEAHATRLAQEMSSLKKTQPQSSESEQSEFEIPKDLEEEIFNSPKTAVAKIIDLAVKQAVGKVKGEQQAQTRETAVKETQEWFTKECSDLAGNRTAALMIEGLAAEAEGSTMLEKFQNATKTYRETVKASAVAAENKARETAAETQRQLDAATMPSGKKATGNGRKVWKESDIEWLMEHDQPQYQRLQHEIVKARQEGRVRRDL